MNGRRFREIISILVTISPVISCGDVNGAEPEDKPHQVAFAELLKEKERGENGVILKLTKAEATEVDPKTSDRKIILKLHWQIEYNGKRWPLVILAPSLDREVGRQTQMSVFAKGRSGKVYRALIEAPNPFVGESSEKDWFLEATKEKPAASGSVSGELSTAKKLFIKYYPDEFSPDVTPELHVLLDHQPADRGKHLMLDAWTGELTTVPKQLIVKRW